MTQIIAHRGFSGRYPENTIPAIQAAIALGVDMVEIDIHETADGELIVFHDYQLKRICGVRGRVRDITFTRLRQLNPSIPTLAEVLVACRTRFLIEIKRADPLKVAAQLRGQDVILFSFSRTCLGQLDNTGLVRFGLFDRRRLPLKFPVAGIAVNQCMVRSRRYVEQIHRRGWQLFVWTVNRPANMRRFIEWGVDGLITNFPDIALKLR